MTTTRQTYEKAREELYWSGILFAVGALTNHDNVYAGILGHMFDRPKVVVKHDIEKNRRLIASLDVK
jgi:hypothetical protein